MYYVKQFEQSISLIDEAATNDADAETGIAAGGGYNGAITAINAGTGATTAIAAGAGVGAITKTESTPLAAPVLAQVITYNFTDAVVVANQPHTYKFNALSTHVPQNASILAVCPLSLITTATGDTISPVPTITVNYVKAIGSIFVTIPNTLAANMVGKGIVLEVFLAPNN